MVGGLDITKHAKMREMIKKYKGRKEGPKFLGVRYLLAWDQEDFMLRADALKGLQILADNNLTFDWHTPTSGLKTRGISQSCQPFLAPSGAQGVTIFVRPSVRPVLVCQELLIFIFRMTSDQSQVSLRSISGQSQVSLCLLRQTDGA